MIHQPEKCDFVVHAYKKKVQSLVVFFLFPSILSGETCEREAFGSKYAESAAYGNMLVVIIIYIYTSYNDNAQISPFTRIK